MDSNGFHYFCEINFCVISISMLFTIITINLNIPREYYVTSRLVASWNKQIITHIEAFKDPCEFTSYKKYLINYQWPGSKSGCDCTDKKGELFMEKYFDTPCSSDQLSDNCQIIRENESKILHKWKNAFLCYKVLNQSYFDLHKVEKYKKCPINFKSCGKLDTLGNKLCVIISEECPINYISFNSEKLDIIDYYSNNKNEEQGEVFSEIRLSDQDNICFDNREDLFYENEYLLYDIERIKNRKSCTKKIDERFKRLDSMIKTNFYHTNLIDKHLFNLPEYPNLSKANVYLFGSSFIGWKSNDNCKIGRDYEILDKLEEKFEKNKEYFNFIHKKFFLTICFVIMIFGFITYLKYKTFAQNDIINDVKTKFKVIIIYGAFSIINFLIFRVYEKNISLFLNGNKENYNLFTKIFLENCSDEETNKSLNIFGAYFFSIYNKYNYIRYASLVNSLFSGIFCLKILFIKQKIFKTSSEISDSFSSQVKLD